MPYTLGAVPKVPQRTVYFETDPVVYDPSFAPLATDQFPGKSQLEEAGKGVLWLAGIGIVAFIWWAISTLRKAPSEETVVVPSPKTYI